MIRRLLILLNLRHGADVEGTIVEIESNITLRGSNIWILVCAALLASLGLDTNSVAVIIGAMLISPLMSPILGVGLSLGIRDRDMLSHALRQLGIAVGVSLGASVLYFSLTPLGQPTPELMARTHPNLLDVLVALFGGVAGIISNSRRQKTNAIPGVAIATALMPPLCASGFGLARGSWAVFMGSFYLFSINALFISLATYGMVRLMNFPQRDYIDALSRRRSRLVMSSLVVLMAAPSVYFLGTVYHQQRDRRVVETQVVQPLRKLGNEVLKWEIEDRDSLQLVKVYMTGEPVTAEQVEAFKQKLRRRDMPTAELLVSRVNLSPQEVAQLSIEAARNLVQEMQLQAELKIKPQVQTTQAPAPGTALPPTAQLLREVQTLFPAVRSLRASRLRPLLPDTTAPAPTDTLVSVLVQWRPPASAVAVGLNTPRTDTARQPSAAEKARLYQFLRIRLRQDTLALGIGR